MLSDCCGIHQIRKGGTECGWDWNKGRMLVSCRIIREDLTDEVTLQQRTRWMSKKLTTCGMGTAWRWPYAYCDQGNDMWLLFIPYKFCCSIEVFAYCTLWIPEKINIPFTRKYGLEEQIAYLILNDSFLVFRANWSILNISELRNQYLIKYFVGVKSVLTCMVLCEH